MAAPVTTIPPSPIAAAALQPLLQARANKPAKKFSPAAIAPMDSLRKRLWNKLSGQAQVKEIRSSVDKTATATPEQGKQIGVYRQVAREKDPAFAQKRPGRVQAIKAGQLIDPP